MNLWIVNHYAIKPTEPGGTRHFDFAQRMVNRGWDVTIIASSFSHVAHQDRMQGVRGGFRIEVVDGVRFVWIRTRAYHHNDWRRMANMVQFFVRLLFARRDLMRALPAPEIVLGCSVHPLAAEAGLRLAGAASASFLVELRDLWPQSLIEMGALSRGHPIARMLRSLEMRLIQHAKGVIVLSPRARNYVIDRGASARAVHLIPNGIDLQRFSEATETTRYSQQFTIAYAGAHGIANNLDLVVDAAERLRDSAVNVHFVLIGDGPVKPELVARCHKLGLDTVEFLDPVPKAEVASALSAADAMVLTEARNVYGSSNKLFDYLATGKPILFAAHGEHNLLREIRCGIIADTVTAEGLAEAVKRLMALPPEERAAMGTRGKAYVKEHHDWEVLAERLMRVLEEVAEAS